MGSMTPPVVKQGVEARCWAACMESWSYMVGDWPNKAQEVFVQQYGSTNGALDAGSSKFAQFVMDHDLGIQFFNAGKLTAAVVGDLLEGDSGYFMFVEQQSPGRKAHRGCRRRPARGRFRLLHVRRAAVPRKQPCEAGLCGHEPGLYGRDGTSFHPRQLHLGPAGGIKKDDGARARDLG